MDFIVEAGRGLWAIEVKAATSVAARDAHGLVAIGGRARRAVRRLVVFHGARRQQLPDGEGIPLAEFLEREMVQEALRRHTRAYRPGCRSLTLYSERGEVALASSFAEAVLADV